MYKIVVGIFLSLLLCSSINAADLYRVWITDKDDAARLRETDAEAVARIAGGYLVLADSRASQAIETSGVRAELLAVGVEKDHLAIDIGHDRKVVRRLPVIYEEGEFRLYRISGDYWQQADMENQLAPILSDNLQIEYTSPMHYNRGAAATILDLEEVIGLIDQDSLYSYSQHLETFYRRWAGTDSMMAASAWIKSKFESFGYDSVVFDSFTFYHSNYGLRQCRNVVVTKTGTRHPEWEIIVGGHMDAGQVSPGADDNGSGTVGTLEIARVLADIDTDVTFRFITFDGEEWGLHGSWHYSNRSVARGDHIIYMLNMDMIAHYTNDTQANLYYGSEMAFTDLWADLADSLVGITATYNGSSGGSDHWPFIQNGYQATFVQEYDFSDVYHTVHDSTVYLNYEYMTRMVKASLATVYAANVLPPPVIITSVIDGGDGQSLQLNWVPMDPERVDHYWIYYWPDGTSDVDSVSVLGGEQSSAIVAGLTEGQQYGFYVLPYNIDGQTSVEYEIAYGMPYSIPGQTVGLAALPVKYGIRMTWTPNPELDVSHYRVIRDQNLLPDLITDTFFVDDDPDLGRNIHSYQVYTVDVDDNSSDIQGAPIVYSKAAWLDQGRILAINRSHASTGIFLVNEAVTGEYIREALAGFDYDYISDTVHQGDEKLSDLSLHDMIDYELVVIGGESARMDDLGNPASMGGRLDSLAYYLSIGGKVIVFGRWGDLDFEASLPYEEGDQNYAYNRYFGIEARNLVLTTSSDTDLYSDFIGGHAQLPGYPDLSWDSLATVNHSAIYTDVSGIPCVSYPSLDQPGIEILYTYNSSDDGGTTEGQPMAWRNPGPEYQYVYFEMPLSFMGRSNSAAALGRAVLDFGFSSGKSVCSDTADIWAGPDDTVFIYLGNLTGGYTVSNIDQSSIRLNETLMPATIGVIMSHPDFEGEVMEITALSSNLAETYGEVVNSGHENTYTVSWNYQSETDTVSLIGDIILNGYKCGDANADGNVNIGDAVFIIKFVFGGGPPPFPYQAGDVNSDGGTNIGDTVYLINSIFKGGPDPICPSYY
jgi:aminopeptidase YwaD